MPRGFASSAAGRMAKSVGSIGGGECVAENSTERKQMQ